MKINYLDAKILMLLYIFTIYLISIYFVHSSSTTINSIVPPYVLIYERIKIELWRNRST
jgi:hypothetical protein